MSIAKLLIIAALTLTYSIGHAVEIKGSKLVEVGSFFAGSSPDITPEVLGRLKNLSDSIVLVGRHASGVLVAPGIMVTSRHVITDYVTGPTKNCARIPLFIYHEREADGTRSLKLRKLKCEEVLVNEHNDQSAILRVSGGELPYADFARDYDQINPVERGWALGHPFARDFDRSTTRISQGLVALHVREDTDFPHVVHLVTTEGGHSGGAITNAAGEVIGIQLGGVTNFSPGVRVDLGQGPEVIRTFNFAVSMPFLYQKYQWVFNSNIALLKVGGREVVQGTHSSR